VVNAPLFYLLTGGFRGLTPEYVQTNNIITFPKNPDLAIFIIFIIRAILYLLSYSRNEDL